MYPLDPTSKLSWEKLKNLDNISEDRLRKEHPDYFRVKDFYQLKTEGVDKVLVIDNPSEKVQGNIRVFADGLSLPQSILPYKNGVYIAHGSEMFFFADSNNDGKADSHETVLTGFGFNDTHTMAHTLVRGPGGWVHFSHGALNHGEVTATASGNSETIRYSKIARFSLDGKNIEVLNNGFNNIWGVQLKANGQWFGTEANDKSFSLVPLHPMMGYKGIGNEKIRTYQPFPPKFHNFNVGGTGISGLAYDENGNSGFPEQWKNVGFLANPITNNINCVIADRQADGSVISKHLPDFLTCSDDWFRPVNIEFGPDGCLYIADWYNKIVSHNEVARNHPDRDKLHGRIWRVRHKSQKVGNVPNVLEASNSSLIKHLQADILWEKRAAWQQIVDRGAVELIPNLKQLALDSTQESATRIVALWALEGLGDYDKSVITELTKDAEADIRREAVRSLNTFKPSIEEVVELVKPLAKDSHYMVKEQVLRTLETVNKANADSIEILVRACTAATKNTNFGDGYEGNFQNFLARKALEQYPNELLAFLNSPTAEDIPQESIDWATQAVGNKLRVNLVLKNWEDGKKLDEETLISLSSIMDEPQISEKLQSQLADADFLNLALAVQSKVVSAHLQKSIVPGVTKLIKGSAEEQKLALKVAIAYNSSAITKEVEAIIEASPAADIHSSLITALAASPKASQTTLSSLAENADLSTTLRIQAITTLYEAHPQKALGLAKAIVTSSSAEEKQALLNSLAQYNTGLIIILDLIKSKVFELEHVDRTMGSRMMQLHPRHPQTRKAVAKQYKRAHVTHQKALEEKLQNYIQATKKLTGNPATGKAIFSSCLMCHQVGQDGYNIAPALDGSANRDLHHLLTAIVKPNDAIEGGYKTYRLVKADNTILEGYMYSSNDYGVTLSFMGGATMFVPKEQIKKQGFVSDQSFMPESFGNLPEQTMIDLVSYIQTLK